jgi:hypothetical protein
MCKPQNLYFIIHVAKLEKLSSVNPHSAQSRESDFPFPDSVERGKVYERS